MIDAALAYASTGWPVLPLHTPNGKACDCGLGDACASPGKHPRLAHGLSDASTEPERVRKWWEMWPAANVGIAVPDGFVVVDIDGPGGVAALREAGVAMPPTAVARSGRGFHYV